MRTCSERGRSGAANSPEPPSEQKLQPPRPFVPSRFGQVQPEFRESFRERAESEVKLGLAFEKIADLENLTVSEGELETALGRLAIANNIEVKDIRNYVPVEEFKEDLRLQKAAEIVLNNASVLK